MLNAGVARAHARKHRRSTRRRRQGVGRDTHQQLSRMREKLIAQARLGMPDDASREDAIKRLRRRPSLDEFLYLKGLLVSRDPRDRLLAVDVLGQVRSQRMKDQSEADLLKLVTRERDPQVLAALVAALGHRANHVAFPILLRLRAHASPEVRMTVAAFLVDVAPSAEDPKLLDALIALSSDRDSDVRNWATFALSEVEANSKHLVEALWKRAHDTDAETRGEALLGLARRKDPRTLTLLRKELSSDSVGALPVEAAAELADSRLLDVLTSLAEWWDINADLLNEAIRRSKGAQRSGGATPTD